MLILDCKWTGRHVCHIAFLSKHGMHNKNLFCNFLTHPCPSYTLVKNAICTHNTFQSLWHFTTSSVHMFKYWFIPFDFCILCSKCHGKLYNFVLHRSETTTPSRAQQTVLAVACVPIRPTGACLCVQDCAHICRLGGRTVGTLATGV
jgi:hypothetical protein